MSYHHKNADSHYIPVHQKVAEGVHKLNSSNYIPIYCNSITNVVELGYNVMQAIELYSVSL